MEQIKGPVIEEVLHRAHVQEHAKHEATGREIALLWERVNGLAKAGATESQVFNARLVAAQRIEALEERLERALAAAENYRDGLEDALREQDNRLDALEETPDAPLPLRTLWDHFRGWG